MKVLHLRNEALVGRYPRTKVQELFARHDITYLFEDSLPKGLWKQSKELALWCNKECIDWVFWNWEKLEENNYKELYESPRRFKIALFGHEQPQALGALRAYAKYADISLTSSPIYKNEVSGFFPFGIHSYYFTGSRKLFTEKQKRILISGSYRHSRGQLFEWLLANQPFKWPVYFYPPDLRSNHVEKDRTREIVSRYPRYVYEGARNHSSYIPELMTHLNTHSFFIDFTTNSTNYLKFHEDYLSILEQSKDLPGGYCPERILDALWLGTLSWGLYDKAIIEVTKGIVQMYSSLEELVSSVNRAIDDQQWCIEKSREGESAMVELTTEKIIERLAQMFHTGKVSGY